MGNINAIQCAAIIRSNITGTIQHEKKWITLRVLLLRMVEIHSKHLDTDEYENDTDLKYQI